MEKEIKSKKEQEETKEQTFKPHINKTQPKMETDTSQIQAVNTNNLGYQKYLLRVQHAQKLKDELK